MASDFSAGKSAKNAAASMIRNVCSSVMGNPIKERKVDNRADHIAHAITQTGSAVAVGSWGASQIEWLNHNAQAVLALCGIAGALVGVCGLIFNVWRNWPRADRES